MISYGIFVVSRYIIPLVVCIIDKNMYVQESRTTSHLNMPIHVNISEGQDWLTNKLIDKKLELNKFDFTKFREQIVDLQLFNIKRNDLAKTAKNVNSRIYNSY